MAEAKAPRARREIPYYLAIRKFRVHACTDPQESAGGRMLCGAKRPVTWGLRTDDVTRVTCPACVELFRKKFPSVRGCAACGAPLWKGELNPCAKCNPRHAERYADSDKRTGWESSASVLVGATTTHYYDAPKTDGGSSSTSTYDRRIAPYIGHLHEGGWVIDKRPIMGSRAFVDGVLNGPMVNTGLLPAQVDVCPEPSLILLAGLEGEFRALALRKAAAPAWCGLDSVGPEDYASFWRARGARVGRRRGDAIEWEDGQRSAIPAYADREKPHEMDAAPYGEPSPEV